MPVNGTAELYEDVESGPHSVEVTNLPANCSAAGGNPVPFTLLLDSPGVEVGFAINCSAVGAPDA
jgi:hypothetical protein